MVATKLAKGKMQKPIVSAMLLGLVISLSGMAPVSATPQQMDFSGSDEYHLVQCETESELDCVDSFGFIEQNRQEEQEPEHFVLRVRPVFDFRQPNIP